MQFNSFFELINHGGFTVYILIFCSILSLKIALDKFIQFKGLTEALTVQFLADLRQILRKGQIDEARAFVSSQQKRFLGFKYGTPLSAVVLAILTQRDLPKEELFDIAFNKLDTELIHFEKGLGIHATLGSITPFIGLFGTVIGIIKAFSALSLQDAGNYALVINGIAEALVATAAGLFVAIPSVMFYNYFTKRLKINVPIFDSAIREIIWLIKRGHHQA